MNSLASHLLIFLVAPLAIGASVVAALAAILRKPRLCAGSLFKVSAPADAGDSLQLFMALHGLLPSRWTRLRYGTPWIGLECGGAGGMARSYVWMPEGAETFVRALFVAAYPGIQFEPVDVDPLVARDLPQAAAAVRLYRSSFLPIATAHESDPLATLRAVLATARGNDRVQVSIVVRPRAEGWQRKARELADRLRTGRQGFVYEALFGRMEHPRVGHYVEQARAIESKAARLGFDVAMHVWASADNQAAADGYLANVAAALRVFNGTNTFELRAVRKPQRIRDLMQARAFPWGSFVLTPDELAALWHLPAESSPHAETVQSPSVAPPQGLPSVGGRLLGTSDYPGSQRPVALTVADGRRHTLTLASTGGGKTTQYENWTVQEAKAGRGFAVIEPQGGLVTRLLRLLPAARAKDVVLISPDASERSVVINPLEWNNPAERYLLVDHVVAILRSLFASSWGPRLEWLLRNVLLALTAHRRDASLLDVVPFLTNPSFRAGVLKRNDDAMVVQFAAWYESLSEAQRIEVISPLLNKLGGLLANPIVRRLLSGRRSTVNLRTLMDSNGILLANLSSGQWGEASNIIGAVLLMKIWQAAQSRAGVPEDERADFSLYVDEWQRFIAVPETFADALARGRAYRLSMNLCNQSLTQLPRELREAVTANTRTRIVMQVGQDDARFLAKEFAPLDAEALMNLPRYHAAVRLSVDGETSRAFTMALLPPLADEDPAHAELIARSSDERFGRPVAELDAELTEATATAGGAPAPGRRVRR